MIGQVKKRKGAEPVYLQLVGIIKQGIASGYFKPGIRIPSEPKLAKQYGISPMTARHAINVLVDEGLLKRVHGSGTFVKKVEVGTTSFDLESLDTIFYDSDNLDIRILTSTIAKVSDDIRQALDIKEKLPVMHVERLIFYKRKPLLIQISYLPFDPEAPVIENMLEATGLSELLLTKNSSGYKKGSLRLYPAIMTDKERALLQVKDEEVAFKLQYTYFDFSDKASIFGWFIIPHDKLPLRSNVGVWNEQTG